MKDSVKKKSRKLSFTMASKLGTILNITKVIKDLYNKNFNTLKKEMEENNQKTERYQMLMVGSINRAKMVIYRSNLQVQGNPVKVQIYFLTEIEI